MNPLALLVLTATVSPPGSAPLRAPEAPPPAPTVDTPPVAPPPAPSVDATPSAPASASPTPTEPPAPPKRSPPPPSSAPDPEEPVVRAHEGDYGMVFRFGGLGTLFATGNLRTTAPDGASPSSVLFTQVGLKQVFSETWMLTYFFGTGLRRTASESGFGSSVNRTDWGIDVGATLEYHFRIWRRISPFVGANLALGFVDPSGRDNAVTTVGLGPSLGVEYYVFDHVSLQALYQMSLQVELFPGDANRLTLSTQAGGALNLTFYF